MRLAVISPCGLYRYSLRRALDMHGMRQILWVMLNPSTADATQDDPTIRRCIGFSKAWGFAELAVVNLYALRSTDPKALWSASDPIGPDNDDHIRKLAECSDMTVCAWGQPGPVKERALHVRGLLPEAHCLKLNKDGSPGHPLYLPKVLTPQVWT
jgi:hypothetical protein